MDWQVAQWLDINLHPQCYTQPHGEPQHFTTPHVTKKKLIMMRLLVTTEPGQTEMGHFVTHSGLCSTHLYANRQRRTRAPQNPGLTMSFSDVSALTRFWVTMVIKDRINIDILIPPQPEEGFYSLAFEFMLESPHSLVVAGLLWCHIL